MLMTAPCFAHGHDGRRREALAAAATIAFATILALGAGPAAARTADTLHCGDTVTHSVRLTADIRDCPGTGLSVGADGITIDLAGHTIDGVAPTAADCGRLPFDHTGIDDRGGFDRITVRDGTIREFDDGVGGGFGHSRMTNLRLRANRGGIDLGSGDVNDNLDANTIDANVVDDDGAACGLRHGIGLTGSHDSVIARNRITGVGGDESASAITLVTGGRNRVASNTVDDNEGVGVSLFFDADDNTITGNTIAEGAGGIEVTGPGSGNTIADNTIGRTQFFGVLVESADFAPGTPTGNRIARNTIGPAGDGGIILFENERTDVARNTVTGAGTNGAADQPGWGIILDGVSHSLVDRNVVTGGRGRAISVGAAVDENPSALAPTGNVVSRNVAQSTGDDGIRVLAVARDTTVERNTASDNGADGIHVLSASTTLTRNTADRNAGLGIDAVAGVVDGGRNAAGANGNAAECVGVVCAPDV